jgi:short-subunit dehydrogenase involved in D-alanine esterification of teichoic acids
MGMNFPRTATHAIDFGPGGTSGIGCLIACNFNGCGVCVIIGRRARVVLRFMTHGIFSMKIGVARNGDLSLYA